MSKSRLTLKWCYRYLFKQSGLNLGEQTNIIKKGLTAFRLLGNMRIR